MGKGGVMDFQKERETFEKQGNIRIFVKQCLFDDQLNEYSSKTLHEYTLGFINGAWWAWQAAKAQAVPEGFVLVPKEPTKEYKDVISQYLDELWMGEWGCDWDGFICVNGIDPNHVWKIVTNTKAMIEAQEQVG